MGAHAEHIEFIEGEPPRARPARRPRGPRQRFVDQLRTKPGTWAIYSRYPGRGAQSARQAAFDFKRKFPGIEARSVTVGEETICYVVAR